MLQKAYNYTAFNCISAAILLFVFLYTMQKELYFDISTAGSGGSLYRVKDDTGNYSFQYQHSTYDDDRDEIKIFDTSYASFALFWQALIQDKQWFYQHPLYVHAEQRDFVRLQLQGVNWAVYPDKKWQDSHQRQWKKVLSDTDDYYRSRL